MYRLMDRIANGVDPMLKCLESHIVNTGLSDMKAHAEVITTVSWGKHPSVFIWVLNFKNKWRPLFIFVIRIRRNILRSC